MNQMLTLTVPQLQNMMDEYSNIFDIVRIVEPGNTKVLSLHDGKIEENNFQPCFSVWNKDRRCDNCISMRVCHEQVRMTKFEFKDDDIYSVIAVPVAVMEQDQETIVSLELVNKVSDRIVLQAEGSSDTVDSIQKLNRRIYKDSLTGAFNRRYFDEKMYLYEMSHSVPRQIGYILVDVNKFKLVNDQYGHKAGDEVLSLISEALDRCIRNTDRVMRIGGDEFLIVLKECSRVIVERKTEQIKRSVMQIKPSFSDNYHPTVAVGFGYTDQFDGSEDMVEQLFVEADTRMYENKKAPIHEIKRMLVVDDIAMNREILRQCFSTEYAISEAEDGCEALEILKNNHIDVVITDVMMPKMDGLELTRRIRQSKDLVGIIVFVVTQRGEQLELDALHAGADDFLNKPFSPELLRHRIHSVVENNTVKNRINQYQLSFNQNLIPFATVHVDKSGAIIYDYVNQALTKLTGFGADEFCNGSVKLPYKGLEQLVSQVIEKGGRLHETLESSEGTDCCEVVAYAMEQGMCNIIIL